jgi:hypothetical protein
MGRAERIRGAITGREVGRVAAPEPVVSYPTQDPRLETSDRNRAYEIFR